MPNSFATLISGLLRRTDDSDVVAERLDRIEQQLQLAESYSVRAFWRALDAAYSEILKTRRLRCIVCDAEGQRDDFETRISECMFGGGVLERYVCPQCECIFGPQKYLEGNTISNEIATFRSLEPSKDGVYVNWGSGGWNATIPHLRHEGYQVWGYEPAAAESTEFLVTNPAIIAEKFDGLFSNNVIEHFRAPVTQFKEFRERLKPSGRMAHSTPCYRYLYPITRPHTLSHRALT